MKKCFILLIVLLLLLLTFASCAKVEESKAKEVAEDLIEYIEQGDYASASDLFCEDKDETGKTFPELLNEIEKATGLSFQSKVEIVEYTDFTSKYSGIYGTIPCAFLDFIATIDGQRVNIAVDMMEKEDKLECFFFNLEYNNELYQFVCQTE